MYKLLTPPSPNKPFKPSRAYLHLTSEQYLPQLSEKIRGTSFTDAKGSYNDSTLLGPITVEFAPYGRLPASKARRDARQGTIDQDPEFIDFLESLTNPIAKAPSIDVVAERENKTDDAKSVTPLIQYIKDKKANKNKEPSTPAKPVKHGRQESKEGKSPQSEKKPTPKGSKESSGGAIEKKPTPLLKVEKPSRETNKAPVKQPVPAIRPAVSPNVPKSAPVQETTPAPAPPSSAPKQERRRERGNASAAAKILQRDLGIGPSPQSRRRREGTPTASVASPPSDPTSSKTAAENIAGNVRDAQTAQASQAASTSSTATQAPSPPVQPPIAPAASRNQAKGKPQPAPAALPKQAQSSTPKPIALPSVSTGATQAFLKHANPSQGVTEPLLEEAFAPFGTVQKVEIDKKKGFAYIDFADSETLQKAIAASPVKVAQGQVVVLERKTGSSLQNRNTRGGGAIGARGGGAVPQPPRGARGGARAHRGRGQAGNTKAMASSAVPSPNPPKDNAAASTTATTNVSTKEPSTTAAST